MRAIAIPLRAVFFPADLFLPLDLVPDIPEGGEATGRLRRDRKSFKIFYVFVYHAFFNVELAIIMRLFPYSQKNVRKEIVTELYRGGRSRSIFIANKSSPEGFDAVLTVGVCERKSITEPDDVHEDVEFEDGTEIRGWFFNSFNECGLEGEDIVVDFSWEDRGAGTAGCVIERSIGSEGIWPLVRVGFMETEVWDPGRQVWDCAFGCGIGRNVTVILQ